MQRCWFAAMSFTDMQNTKILWATLSTAAAAMDLSPLSFLFQVILTSFEQYDGTV